MTKFEALLAIVVFLASGSMIVVPQIFLLIHIRKLFDSIRKYAAISPPYPPVEDGGKIGKEVSPTSVTINDPLEWAETDAEGRPVVARD